MITVIEETPEDCSDAIRQLNSIGKNKNPKVTRIDLIINDVGCRWK